MECVAQTEIANVMMDSSKPIMEHNAQSARMVSSRPQRAIAKSVRLGATNARLALVSALLASLVLRKTLMTARNVSLLNNLHPADLNAQNSRSVTGLHVRLVPPLVNPAPEVLQTIVPFVHKDYTC